MQTAEFTDLTTISGNRPFENPLLVPAKIEPDYDPATAETIEFCMLPGLEEAE